MNFSAGPFRNVLSVLALAAAATLAAASARAEDYPSRPVKILVPFGAGGPTDIYTRDIAEELRKSLHQPFVLENRPGAGTTVGTDLAAHAAPDGYTLLMVSSTQTVNETLYVTKPYELLRDLIPIAPLMENDLVLVVPPSLPVKNLTDLLALARAKPGTLNFGSSGPGSNYHMAAELLKNLAGINIVHVPYKSTPPAIEDIIAGRVSMMFADFTTAMPHVAAGTLRAIAISRIKRSTLFPDLPTMDEAGLKGFNLDAWAGLVAPAGAPPDVVAKLNAVSRKIIDSPDVQAKFKNVGFEGFSSTPEELGDYIKAQLVEWKKMVTDANIQPD
jgi:tripartite-type tricarboxylate transporter receptor subunit TctC